MQKIRMQTLEELQVLILGQVGYVWLLHFPLINKERTVYIGCEFHNHSRVLACPYEKYGCMYYKATYHWLAGALEHEK